MPNYSSNSKPPLFLTLIGNHKAKEILRRLLSHQALPSVLLFHGPDGIGKGHFAMEVARALVANDKKEHPDIHLVLPDPKSGQHPVAAIRALLEEAGMPPFEAPAKIFIIHDADKMLPVSSNTLLKTLEEPPPRTYFILLTSQFESILPTIISRCCKIAFFPIPEEELALFLAEKHLTSDGKKVALLAEGSVSEAIRRASNPSRLPVAELLRVKNYTELYDRLNNLKDLPDDASPADADPIFEEILYTLREIDPMSLDRALPLISEARHALHHHVKLKNVLERFFIAFIVK
jgi:hypothetical protein